MALQTSGAISLNDIHIEAGGSSGTNASINDADIRGMISKTAGTTMSFSEWYGASSTITMTYVLNAFATANANISQNVYTGCQAGDLIIVAGGESRPNTVTMEFPSRITNVFNANQNRRYISAGKDSYYMYSDGQIGYRIATQNNDYFTIPPASGENTHFRYHVYRPSSSLSSVSWTLTGSSPYDNDTSDSFTINSGTTAPIIAVIGGACSSISMTGGVATAGYGTNIYSLGGLATIYDANGGSNSGSGSTGHGQPPNLGAGYFTWS